MKNFQPLPDDPLQRIEAAVSAALAEQWETVEENLRSIQQLIPTKKELHEGCYAPSVPRIDTDKHPNPGRYPTNIIRMEVFRRDRFICGYCGSRTLFRPILHYLSSICASDLIDERGLFQYDTGSSREANAIYEIYRSCCDHKVPLAHGGCNHMENLITACSRCNNFKGPSDLGGDQNQLDWTTHNQTAHQWDGLSGYFPELYTLCKARGVVDIIDNTKTWLPRFK